MAAYSFKPVRKRPQAGSGLTQGISPGGMGVGQGLLANYGTVVQKAPGGAYHVTPDGKRTFVPATPQAAFTGQAQDASAATKAKFAPDSTYFAEAATNLFNKGRQIGDLTKEEGDDRTNLAEALRRLNGEQPKSELRAKQGRNQQGLLYSGALTNDLNDIAVAYARQRSDAEMGFQGRQNAREATRHALEAGYSVEDAAAIGRAVDRGVDRDTAAADDGSLTLNPSTVPITTSSQPRLAGPGRKQKTTPAKRKRRKR